LTKIVSLVAVIFIMQPYKLFSQPANLPKPDHIVVVIYENHNYDDIIGSSTFPNINALATDDHSALFTNYQVIEHPSQPNYFDLYAGCNQGVQDDAVPANNPFTTDNLGKELIDAGKTFITYAEDLPSVGYNGNTSSLYARKHNPSVNWMGTGTNQIPITTDQPFTAFPSDFTKLPTVSFVIPNLVDDMHDAPVTTSDTWLKTNLNPYVQWAKTHNSLLIFTFDEDELSTDGRIVTIFAGQMVKPGQYAEALNHYNILRTIEDIYNLRYACNAANVTPITDVWTNSSIVIGSGSESVDGFLLYPNPANDGFIIARGSKNIETLEKIEIFDVIGNKVFEKNIESLPEKISGMHLPSGAYSVKVSSEKTTYTQKLIIQ